MTPRVNLIIGIVFLAVGILATINFWRFNNYVKETLVRDEAQEQCIVDQSVWLQDWLQWRWVENVDATTEQIKQYHRDQPLPPCRIRK